MRYLNLELTMIAMGLLGLFGCDDHECNVYPRRCAVIDIKASSDTINKATPTNIQFEYKLVDRYSRMPGLSAGWIEQDSGRTKVNVTIQTTMSPDSFMALPDTTAWANLKPGTATLVIKQEKYGEGHAPLTVTGRDIKWLPLASHYMEANIDKTSCGALPVTMQAGVLSNKNIILYYMSWDGSNGCKKQFGYYSVNSTATPTMLGPAMPGLGGQFQINTVNPHESLAGYFQDKILWFKKQLGNPGQYVIQNCLTTATSDTAGCSWLAASPVQLDIKALTVHPGGAFMAIVDNSGAIRRSLTTASTWTDVAVGPLSLDLLAGGTLDSMRNMIIGIDSSGKDAKLAVGAADAVAIDSMKSSSLKAAVSMAGNSAVAVGDVDGNSLGDLVLARGNKIYVAVNAGNDTFSIPSSASIELPTAATVSALALGNIDDDPALDLIAVSRATQTIYVYLNR